MSLSRAYLGVIMCCLLLLSPCVFLPNASASDGDTYDPTAAWGGPSDITELEEFIDERVTDLNAKYHVLGTSVSVVKGGEMVLSKGYGYADAEQQKAVSPADTLFRIGSVSKLFTWTAVMQLVEQGKIDLDTDVNVYLKNYHLADAYGGPVTMRHLMTHTAGFDETTRGMVSDEIAHMPMEEYLNFSMPQRINAPGQWVSYSNHGVMLAALIVQDVSGIRFQDYVQMSIFDPLGMFNTTFEQPPAPELMERLSGGFTFTGDGHLAGEFEYITTIGAGEVSSSVEDMAKFMLMHLNNGTYNGARILNETTAEYMHSVQFRPAPEAAAFGLGFYEMNWRDNVTIIGHGGDTSLFHSKMLLFPERGLGLFITTNTDTGSSLASNLPYDFVGHYFPVEERTLPTPGPESIAHANEVAGIYLNYRTAHTTVEKYLGKPSEWKVEATGDGYISLHIGQKAFKAVELSPYRYAFLETPSPELGDILFVLDAGGKPSHMVFTGIAVAGTYEKLGAMTQQNIVTDVLVIAEILLISSFLWIGVALYRWRRGVERLVSPQIVLMVASATALAFVYLVQNAVDLEQQYFTWSLTTQSPEPLSTYMLMPVLVVLLFVAAVVLAMVTIWAGRTWSRWERAHAIVVAVGLVGFLYWSHFWRLI